MNESISHDIPKVSERENEILTAPFGEENVRKAIFQMEHNEAPGANGFSAEFYQVFWKVIKDNLMALFMIFIYDFHQGQLLIYSLNFGVIALLPEKGNAIKIQEYRPICLLNVSFKIFTKVATNRISNVAEKVIRPT
jgi:hypothetical protein